MKNKQKGIWTVLYAMVLLPISIGMYAYTFNMGLMFWKNGELQQAADAAALAGACSYTENEEKPETNKHPKADQTAAEFVKSNIQEIRNETDYPLPTPKDKEKDDRFAIKMEEPAIDQVEDDLCYKVTLKRTVQFLSHKWFPKQLYQEAETYATIPIAPKSIITIPGKITYRNKTNGQAINISNRNLRDLYFEEQMAKWIERKYPTTGKSNEDHKKIQSNEITLPLNEKTNYYEISPEEKTESTNKTKLDITITRQYGRTDSIYIYIDNFVDYISIHIKENKENNPLIKEKERPWIILYPYDNKTKATIELESYFTGACIMPYTDVYIKNIGPLKEEYSFTGSIYAQNLEYETWISNKSLIPERIRLTNSRIKKIRPNSKEDF